MTNQKPEASELEYLKFFFDNAKVSVQERIFLEESFELCYNGTVPLALKAEVSVISKQPTIEQIPLDNTQDSDYDLSSEEHMSLDVLIAQLKELTENDT